MFFNRKFKTKKDVINFINKKRISIKDPKNFEEFVLSKLGKEIYEKLNKEFAQAIADPFPEKEQLLDTVYYR